MAPGLISRLSQDELGKRHRNTAQHEQACTSSTASSPSQASPVLHAADAGMRATTGALPSAGANATQGEDTALLLDNVLVDQLKKTLATSTEQNRQFDEILSTWKATYRTPRFARAYSEGALPPRAPDSDPNTGLSSKKETRYQATVEDCIDSDDEEDTPTSSCSPGIPPAILEEIRPRPEHTFAASAPTSPVVTPTLTTETSAPAAMPTIKEVRFSDRNPVVLQRSASTRHTAWTGGSGTAEKSNTHIPRERISSPLDEKWGILFSPHGVPTTRMRDIIRGLAVHLIDVSKPAYSLVLTPEKLYQFYSKYRLDREAADFTGVFRASSRAAMHILEQLYLDVQCDYHLVQDNATGRKERPYIPALTPEGFVQWTVVLMRAFPSHEAARLSRVIAELPLEAVANDPLAEPERRERLPRQISRRLFPIEPNRDAAQVVSRAMQAATGARPQVVQNPPPPPLIHSDARSRQEHLNRCRRDYDGEMMMDVPRPKRTSPERESGSSRYNRSYARQESPRREKRPERRDTREPEREKPRRDRGLSLDGYDDVRYRRRDRRGSRA
ncbi:hypothetical protein NLG97_g6156 [Lecanicillium saksenae]|uniref:Uncharacterized protein n=1 Tax=Lecanicillium saksenae TaxID=468837 RepID=A0ACC1QU90_9HYPO|nr:hypothetical protein NLG97_g6156 [Lecanicillium saksenae]